MIKSRSSLIWPNTMRIRGEYHHESPVYPLQPGLQLGQECSDYKQAVDENMPLEGMAQYGFDGAHTYYLQQQQQELSQADVDEQLAHHRLDRFGTSSAPAQPNPEIYTTRLPTLNHRQQHHQDVDCPAAAVGAATSVHADRLLLDEDMMYMNAFSPQELPLYSHSDHHQHQHQQHHHYHHHHHHHQHRQQQEHQHQQEQLFQARQDQQQLQGLLTAAAVDASQQPFNTVNSIEAASYQWGMLNPMYQQQQQHQHSGSDDYEDPRSMSDTMSHWSVTDSRRCSEQGPGDGSMAAAAAALSAYSSPERSFQPATAAAAAAAAAAPQGASGAGPSTRCPRALARHRQLKRESSEPGSSVPASPWPSSNQDRGSDLDLSQSKTASTSTSTSASADGKAGSKMFFCRQLGCPQAAPVRFLPITCTSWQGFPTRKDRARHEAKHNPSIKCQWVGPGGERCHRVFSRTDNMKDHMRRKHP